ncbi:transporter [Gilvibacter sp.]|uniref:transporter n=1 Tax=Gilvibacter sp. TaxID=2729997 RepID=UPI003F4A67FD
MKLKKITIVFTLLLSVTSIYAQDDPGLGPLITDRPDATESPNTVPVGFVQFETGAFFTREENSGFTTESTTFNTMLVRYGILDNMELRLGWNFTETRFSLNDMELDDVLSGLDPLLLGAKVAIAQENGLLPDIGLIGHVFLPFTAGRDYKPEYTGVDFRFSFGHTLSDRSSLSYNLGAQWGGDSPEAEYVYTIAYGYAITDAFGAYVELYGELPEDSGPNHLWDAGFTYLVNDDLQLDATIGSGIRSDQELLISAGLSYRLDLRNKK